MAHENLDQLVLLILAGSQAGPLMKGLNKEDFRFTIINSTGGLLQEAELCLLIGFMHERLPSLLEIVHTHCHSFTKYIPTQGLMPMEQGAVPMMEAQVGGAMICLMNVDRFEQL